MQNNTARPEAVRTARGSHEESLLAALDLDMPTFPDLERLLERIGGAGWREGEQG